MFISSDDQEVNTGVDLDREINWDKVNLSKFAIALMTINASLSLVWLYNAFVFSGYESGSCDHMII